MKKRICLALCVVFMLTMFSVFSHADVGDGKEICPTEDPTLEQMAAYIDRYIDDGAGKHVQVAFQFNPNNYAGFETAFVPLITQNWGEYLFTLYKCNLYGNDYQTALLGTSYSYMETSGVITGFRAVMDLKMTDNTAFKTKIDTIVAAAKASASDKRRQLKYLHEYLRANVVYDPAVQQDSGSETALMRGKAICMGYSRAVGEFCREINVPCLYISSSNHMWNSVYVDGKWYHIDATQDFFLKEDDYFPRADWDNDHKYDTKYKRWGQQFLLNGMTGDAEIVGEARRGTLLRMEVETDSAETLHYEWRRNDVAIPGATDAAYRLTVNDVGKRVSCVVSTASSYGKLKDATAVVADLAAGEHIWDEGVVTEAPTCKKAGTRTYTCLDCGVTRTEEIAKTVHNWNAGVVTKEATCSETGQRVVTCTICGDQIITDIPKPEHTWGGEVVIKNPGCTEAGEKRYTCTVCQQTRSETIAPEGHSWEVSHVETPATCSAEGSSLIFCTRCGQQDHRAIPKIAHTWNNGVVTRAATCAKEGVRQYTCTVCGGTRNETIEKTAHTWAKDYTVDREATVSAVGQKSIHCTVCNAIKPGSMVVIPKLSPRNVFSDVPAKAWFKEAVYYTVDRGIFAGITATTFCPNDDMTRAMFVATLSRIAGVAVSNKSITVFSDVKSGQWYTGAVKWASDNGIVAGSNGRFMPNEPITREQICTILLTYSKYMKITLKPKQAAVTFKDAKKISSWSKSAVTTCQRAGLVAGADGVFNPQGKANRAQVAQILAAFHKNYCSGE